MPSQTENLSLCVEKILSIGRVFPTLLRRILGRLSGTASDEGAPAIGDVGGAWFRLRASKATLPSTREASEPRLTRAKRLKECNDGDVGCWVDRERDGAPGMPDGEALVGMQEKCKVL